MLQRGVAGRYAKKHDPFAYWASTRCGPRASFDALDRDLRRGTLPPFALVVPDLCHDMHDCSVADGDRYLSVLVPRLLKALGPHGYSSSPSTKGDSVVGSTAAGGSRRSSRARGSRAAAPGPTVNHYGVLRTIEDTFGLRHLGAAADPRSGSLRGLLPLDRGAAVVPRQRGLELRREREQVALARRLTDDLDADRQVEVIAVVQRQRDRR